MTDSWLVLPAGPRRQLPPPTSGLTFVDPAVLALPCAVPVARGEREAVSALARKLEGLVVHEEKLAEARGARCVVKRLALSPARDQLLVDDGTALRRSDIVKTFALRSDDGPQLVFQTQAQLFVLAAGATDLSAIFPGADSESALRQLVQSLPSFLGSPLDTSLLSPAAGGLLAVAADLLDVLDMMRVARPPAAARAQRSEGAPAVPPSAVSSAVMREPAESTFQMACKKCSSPMTEQDVYQVFEEPICRSCAHPYLEGHLQRAAILGGVFFLSIVLFLALTWYLDFIGRALGVLIVLFVFRTILSTGAQYDFDVEQGLGPRRRRVRRAGFFSWWAAVDNHWWGKWLLHRALYVGLGIMAWFVPIGRAAAAGINEDGAHAAADELAESEPTVTLRPMVGFAQTDGLHLELIELRGGEAPVAVLDAKKDGKTKRIHVELTEDIQTTFGVRWVIVDVTLPPDAPSLVVAFPRRD